MMAEYFFVAICNALYILHVDVNTGFFYIFYRPRCNVHILPLPSVLIAHHSSVCFSWIVKDLVFLLSHRFILGIQFALLP